MAVSKTLALKMPLDARDIVTLGMLSGLTALSWSLPESQWLAAAQCVAKVRRSLRRAEDDLSGHIEMMLAGHRISSTPTAIASAYSRNRFLERLQLLRCHRFGGWEPETRLLGQEHVDRALSAGKGAILWNTPLVFNDLATKVAFHRAGYAVRHLSRYMHNFSSSSLGSRLINPVRTSIERKYLKERIVIGPNERVGDLKPLDVLRDRLDKGGLVSITVLRFGRRTMIVPVFRGAMRLATGAAHLSCASGAPLLPVFTIREASGRFLTTIEPPLPTDMHTAEPEPYRPALCTYTGLLERHVLSSPDQFRWKDTVSESKGVEHRSALTVSRE